MSNPQWTSNQRPGRDPRQPFGTTASQAPVQPNSIDAFQEPRRNLGRNIVIGVAVLAIAGVSLILLQTLSPEATGPQAGPTTGPSLVASSLGATGSSVPFEGNGSGTFEVLSSAWEEDQLEVRVRITLEEGSTSFAVQLYDNDSMERHFALEPDPIKVSGGSSVEATLTYPLPPSDNCTLVLTNNYDKALAALPVNR